MGIRCSRNVVNTQLREKGGNCNVEKKRKKKFKIVYDYLV